MAPYSGTQKLEFRRRLGDDWKDLADCLEIPPDKQNGFQNGHQPRSLWEWLEQRNKLDQLSEALKYIDREDIVVEILAPPAPAEPPCKALWQGSPFPGLCPFAEEDAPIFFGRQAETSQLRDRLARERFVAVVGASGSGKSSLVTAGLIPSLGEIPGGREWKRARFTPAALGDDPFLALGARLEPGLEHLGLNGRTIADKLYATGELAELAEHFLKGRGPAGTELLLFVDQFEELFQTKAESQRRFVAMLEKATRSALIRVVLTLRADFFERCLNHAPLELLLRTGTFPLGAPDMTALLEMITGPAELAGLQFEEGLAGRILRDTGSEAGALALMAFALSELCELCMPANTLSQAGYASFGGVRGVIARRADSVYVKLDDSAQRSLDEVFKELVQVDPERGVLTRKRALKSHFGSSPTAQQLIEEFTKARLFVCGEIEHHEVVEVAHEALLTNWPLLKAWGNRRFDDFRQLYHLKLDAAEWKRAGRKEAHLWRHERLKPVYEMLERLQPQLSEDEREFIRLEAERLLEEIADPATTHQRRATIGDRLAQIGDPRPGVGLDGQGLPDIDWCPVPGGPIKLAGKDGTFQVKPFYTSRYPTTWAQYRSFLEAKDGYRNAEWWEGLAERDENPGSQRRELANHPAENVSWYDAVAFCRWLSRRLGYEVRLPTEWEWQQAATGGHSSNQYPWGKEWNPDFANTWEVGLSRTTAVGLYPQGASPVGVLDMSGNVLEWCLNEHEEPKNIGPSGNAPRVVRGGSWHDDQYGARASCRFVYSPGYRFGYLGFRVVSGSPIFS